MRGPAIAALMLLGACSGPRVTHFDPAGPKPAGIAADARAPFSASVLAGDTLYLAGVLDLDPATRRPGTNAPESARLVMEALKRSVEAAGMTMDDLVWVQVFATDLSSFDDFGAVYSGYFTGPLPARSFVGVAGLMGGARFEVNGIAVRRRRG
ncbi:RidA family protein [Sphingomonas canadensis]|uniref:RidA family protein n=1 Tax=Sphingomonas canadensis TaxID=1219257 RepID=A0ABW3HDQ7_9SPHN|nr:Rid family hydrolase [Sphingomonas canadensis]MCW3838241.1 Rid family hydrolase [Sphingomonas canadensis]